MLALDHLPFPGPDLAATAAAFAAHKRGDGRASHAILDRKAGGGALNAQDELLRGWCLLDLNRAGEAALAFERAQFGAHPGERGFEGGAFRHGAG